MCADDPAFIAYTREQFTRAAETIHAMDPDVNILLMHRDLVAWLSAYPDHAAVSIPTWCAAYALGWRAARGR